MLIAYGQINALMRDGRLVYEAMYQPSYRHTWRRLAPSDRASHWSTEDAAIIALERRAEEDGAGITIQAGTYPRGTRRTGDIIARAITKQERH